MRFISKIDARLTDGAWDYAAAHAGEIARSWAEWTATAPALFNGKVLVLTEATIAGETFQGRYAETDYAAFLHFMRVGRAAGRARNAFALGALTAADDALIMGVMADHTANAGKVYFPGGTPDLDDVVDGKVDLDGSVRREIGEETGLTADDVTFEPGFWLHEDEKRLAFLKIVRSPLPAAALRALILSRIRLDPEPELADILVIRNDADLLPDRMPAFQLAYARWWFANRGL